MERVYLPFDARMRIQDLLKSSGLSQSDLAKKIGLGASTLSRYINGQYDRIGAEYILRMARIFSVSTDFLLGLTNVPDRKNYAIDELGLTPQAARNLYTKEIDPRVVSYLLESIHFANTTRQIARYMDGSLAAGYMAQNVIQQKLSMMLLKNGQKEAARQVRSMTAPIYQQDLSEIQASFMEAVQEMKTDVSLETCVEAMTKKQLDEMLRSLEQTITGKQKPLTSKEFSSMIVDSVEWMDMARPESLEKLREALTMIADDLRSADRRASDDQ